MSKCKPSEVKLNAKAVIGWDDGTLASVIPSIERGVLKNPTSFNATARAYHRFCRREARRRGLI